MQGGGGGCRGEVYLTPRVLVGPGRDLFLPLLGKHLQNFKDQYVSQHLVYTTFKVYNVLRHLM